MFTAVALRKPKSAWINEEDTKNGREVKGDPTIDDAGVQRRPRRGGRLITSADGGD